MLWDNFFWKLKNCVAAKAPSDRFNKELNAKSQAGKDRWDFYKTQELWEKEGGIFQPDTEEMICSV